ncbi:Mg chelatase-like protein [Anopheles sinensis]|uniref:Mg chelatase-like protein n=1 Tax=Anopheles sinensis TaxID=74873 RepID=A0A084WNQ7_ANOSI|nr:Mg chelatase-like protein [Anopheles sinensis]
MSAYTRLLPRTSTRDLNCGGSDRSILVGFNRTEAARRNRPYSRPTDRRPLHSRSPSSRAALRATVKGIQLPAIIQLPLLRRNGFKECTKACRVEPTSVTGEIPSRSGGRNRYHRSDQLSGARDIVYSQVCYTSAVKGQGIDRPPNPAPAGRFRAGDNLLPRQHFYFTYPFSV